MLITDRILLLLLSHCYYFGFSILLGEYCREFYHSILLPQSVVFGYFLLLWTCLLENSLCRFVLHVRCCLYASDVSVDKQIAQPLTGPLQFRIFPPSLGTKKQQNSIVSFGWLVKWNISPILVPFSFRITTAWTGSLLESLKDYQMNSKMTSKSAHSQNACPQQSNWLTHANPKSMSSLSTTLKFKFFPTSNYRHHPRYLLVSVLMTCAYRTI